MKAQDQAVVSPAVGHFQVKRTYLMGRDEIFFVNSLPRLYGDNEIEYTAAHTRKLQAICDRLTFMNGQAEWKWMLKGANTTDQKYPKARAMHIFLKGVKDLKPRLDPMRAADEFMSALNMSHIWYRQLLANAYEMVP